MFSRIPAKQNHIQHTYKLLSCEMHPNHPPGGISDDNRNISGNSGGAAVVCDVATGEDGVAQPRLLY